MPDYLPRSPVGDVEEDPDEILFLISKSTQTDVSGDNSYSSIITTVKTRAMKLKNQTSHDSSNTKKSTLDSLNASTRENRTISFSVEQLIQVHRNDSYAIHILNNIKNYKAYIVKDNLLMHLSNLSVPYVPQGDFRKTILRIYHDTAAMVRISAEIKKIHKTKKRYFWPSMYKDINNYIMTYLPRVQFNPRQKLSGALRSIKLLNGVRELVSIDFHGPISPTSQYGNKYIICLTDILSKFVITKAVHDNTAQTAVRFLEEDIITKFGTLRSIIIDNETHFIPTIMN